MIVQHNLTAMNSNRMLGLTSSTQAKSTEKLSSGYRINRAADDAAGLSISEKMRKQIRGLTQASANAQDGISAVQTAEGALNEVQDMLQRMNELAVKAANGTNSEDDRSYIQDEIDQLVTEIDRVAETTKFNETYLLKGDSNAPVKTNFQYQAADVTKQDYYYVDKQGNVQVVEKGSPKSAIDTTDGVYFKNDKAGLVGEKLDKDADKGKLISAVDIVNATDLYKQTEDGKYVLVDPNEELNKTPSYYYKVKFNTDGTVSAATAQKTVDGKSGYVITGDVRDKNGVKIAEGTIVSESQLADLYKNVKEGFLDNNNIVTPEYEKAVAQFVDKDGNEIAANGLDKYLNDDGTLKAGGGLYLKSGNKIVGATQDDVNAMVDKSGKYDVGALTLTLHVGADATKNNQISVELDAMSAVSLGINKVRVDGSDDSNALNAIETIKAAIQKVSTQRSALGAVQNRLEHTINNLDNVVENTTSAEAAIRDTDMASEMVKYSNNNILAQAGQAMLAQANQANQGVLSLLG